MYSHKLFLATACAAITVLSTPATAQQWGYRQHSLPPTQWITPNAGATQMYGWGMQPQQPVYPQVRPPQQYYPVQPQPWGQQQWITPNAGATPMYPSNINPNRNYYYYR